MNCGKLRVDSPSTAYLCVAPKSSVTVAAANAGAARISHHDQRTARHRQRRENRPRDEPPNNAVNTPAASGMPIALKARAQNRFCLMTRNVARHNRRSHMSISRLPVRTMSADSIATSAPAPIAMPTSAA